MRPVTKILRNLQRDIYKEGDIDTISRICLEDAINTYNINSNVMDHVKDRRRKAQ